MRQLTIVVAFTVGLHAARPSELDAGLRQAAEYIAQPVDDSDC